MRHFDVFNGDADGLCALTQLRLSDPRRSTFITGVKRDITLLSAVDAECDDALTVLDISLDSNRSALERILKVGAQVDYFDHHFAGQIPDSPKLVAHIDTSPKVCTSLIVDRYLSGAFKCWAITAAFGDNLMEVGDVLARQYDLSDADTHRLRQLGQGLNYNAYGESIDDLRYHPAVLARLLVDARDPFVFIEDGPHFEVLTAGLVEDLALARQVRPIAEGSHAVAYLLPDLAWARRVSGMFANELAIAHPYRAHAILTHNSTGDYAVSVRAPVNKPAEADTLCRAFATGGGRSAAAGINRLAQDQLAVFIDSFRRQYAP